MAQYVCVQLNDGICNQWAVQETLLDVLAITPTQAVEIAIAISMVLITGFIIGQIGHMIKTSFMSRF